jgi:hypothetical protein
MAVRVAQWKDQVPATSEVQDSIPSRTCSACALFDSVGFLRGSGFLLYYITHRPILSMEPYNARSKNDTRLSIQ